MAVAEADGGTPTGSAPQEGTTSVAGAGPSPDSEAFHRSENAAGRWLYADKPLEPGDPDALNFGAYADALALVMDWKETSTPLTIAINGPWGSGKTSLAKMTEARLPIGSDWDAPHVICWFDAWANDDAPHLTIFNSGSYWAWSPGAW
jgi:KAP family P-loop domain